MYYKGNRKLLPRIAQLYKSGLQVDYNLLHFIPNLLHFYHTTTTYYRIFIEKNIIFTRSFTTFIQFLSHIGTSIKAQIQGSSSLLFIRETLLWQIMVFLSRRVACWTSFKFTSILKKKLQILIRINSKKSASFLEYYEIKQCLFRRLKCRRLYTTPCGILTKWLWGRRIPL